MVRGFPSLCGGALLALFFASAGFAQNPLTWDEVRQRFEVNNPNIRAGQLGIDESKANEISAYLRPNPTATILADQIDPFPGGPSHGPFSFLLTSATVSYLHERRHKRELRLESAKEATDIAVSGQADLDRTLVFELRAPLCKRFKPKRYSNWREKISNTTNTFWISTASVSRPAASLKSTWSDSNCSACSTNRTCKPPKSIS